MTAPQRIYLAGAGQIARLHATIAYALTDREVEVSVVDTSPQILASFGEQFPRARRCTSLDELLAEPSRADDIVVIATPPFAHAEVARRAIESGRHVLCEKPLAMDAAEAAAMIDVARARGLLVADCASRFRHLATTRALRSLLPELGPLHRMRYTHRRQRNRAGVDSDNPAWFLDRSKSGGGVLMDWGPYDLGLIDDLLAPVSVEVRDAWTANPRTGGTPAHPGAVFDVEEQVGAALVYHLPGGGLVHVDYEHAACTHGPGQRDVVLDGVDGSAHWDWFAGIIGSTEPPRIVHGFDDGGAVATRTIDVTDGESGYQINAKLLGRFADLVRSDGDHDPYLLINDEALFVFSCLRAIYDVATERAPRYVRRDRQEAA